MKILLVNNLLPPLGLGGAETVTMSLASDLEFLGHEVYFASTRTYFSKDVSTSKHLLLPSLFPSLSKLPLLIRFVWHVLDQLNPINPWRLSSWAKSRGVELVITNNIKGLGMLSPLCLGRVANVVHIIHDVQLLHPSGLVLYGHENKLNSFLSRLYQKINAFFFKSVRLVIAPSEWVLKEHQSRGFFPMAKLHRISNQIPSSSERDDKRLPSSDVKRLLYVGKIDKHKGLSDLISLLRTIPRRDWILDVMGDGPELARSKELARGLEIVFHGWQTKESIMKRLEKADLLIVPSLCYENSPTVIYEAASKGCPFLGTNLGGVPELAKIYMGWVYEPGNKDSFQENFNRAISAQKKASPRPAGERSAQRILKLAEEVFG